MYRVARFSVTRTDGTVHTWYEVRDVSPFDAARDRLEIDNRTVFANHDDAQRMVLAKNKEPVPSGTPPVLKAGHVVRLKSGGPDMTVEKVMDPTAVGQTVWCVWFPGHEEGGAWKPALTTTFQVDALELVVPN